jgi:HEPN domain-containing protein
VDGMKKADFEELSSVRLEEALALLDDGHWDGAYYLAGYAVECALKACICNQAGAHDFPPKDTNKTHYTHNLVELIRTAGLQDSLATLVRQDADFSDNWNTVRQWGEQSRYNRWSETHARSLLVAITEPLHGVLAWVKLSW